MTENKLKDRNTAGWLAIILGGFGAHQFYMNHISSGIIRLCVSIFSFGIGLAIVEILGIVEGIKYLKMSDEEFKTVYVEGGKSWL